MMIVLFLKEEHIDSLSPEIAMFYRMAAFANGTSGNHLRRLAFDNEPRIQTFMDAFPEIVPYIINPNPTTEEMKEWAHDPEVE